MDEKHFEDVKSRVLEELKNHITPELSNRIDHKIVFKPLNKDNLKEIFNNQMKVFLEAWKQNKNVELPKFTKKEVDSIIDKIYDPAF
jgi:ATP-dependent Clp protease ATP-binding subunit ClpC